MLSLYLFKVTVIYSFAIVYKQKRTQSREDAKIRKKITESDHAGNESLVSFFICLSVCIRVYLRFHFYGGWRQLCVVYMRFHFSGRCIIFTFQTPVQALFPSQTPASLLPAFYYVRYIPCYTLHHSILSIGYKHFPCLILW